MAKKNNDKCLEFWKSKIRSLSFQDLYALRQGAEERRKMFFSTLAKYGAAVDEDWEYPDEKHAEFKAYRAYLDAEVAAIKQLDKSLLILDELLAQKCPFKKDFHKPALGRCPECRTVIPTPLKSAKKKKK